ncbi:LCP family protein [Rubneribacter sp.]|nr:LCP family protein [Candidatus Rubneribacter avistercoris]
MGFSNDERYAAHGRHDASAHRGGARGSVQGGSGAHGSGGRIPSGRVPQSPRSSHVAGVRPVQGAAYPGWQGGQGGGYPSSNDEIIRVRKKRKKHKKLKRALLVAAIVLVVLVGGAAAYAAWYTGTLSSNMALDEQERSELDTVLTAADSQQEPFYVLLVGSDNWETYGERSDALVLLRIDPVGHQITMVSVPRDTPYMLNGNKVKINQAFSEEGAAGAVTAVQELTGVPISYYAEIEFAGLAEFVDSMGGIYVDVPYTIDYEVYTKDQDVVHIEAGNQLLDGTQCVALARMRTAYGDDQDAVRQSNVRAMVLALMKSVLQSPPVEVPGLVQRLSSCVSTNMDLQTMASLATDFASAGDPVVYTCTGPYKGDIDQETGLWLCYEDPEGWAALMEAVDSGQNPESAATTVEGK